MKTPRIAQKALILSFAVILPLSAHAGFLDWLKEKFGSKKEVVTEDTSGAIEKVDADYLRQLLARAYQGDKESLKKLCSYVKKSDLYDLGDLNVEEDLRASCAELK